MDGTKALIWLTTVIVVSVMHMWLRTLSRAPRLHLALFSVIWGVLLGAFCVSSPPYQISNEVYAWFALAWVLVYVGQAVACIWFPVAQQAPALPSESPYSYPLLRYFLWMIVLLSVAGNYFFIRNVMGQLASPEALAALRTPEGSDLIRESSGMLYNVFGRIYVVYLPLGFYLFRQRALAPVWMVALIMLALISSVVTFTRAPVLFLFVTIWISIAVLQIRVKWWVWLIAAAAFLGVMIYATAQILELAGEETALGSLGNAFSEYFMGSLVAFNELYDGHFFDPQAYDSRWYSLDFVNYFLAKVGIIQSYPSLVRPYADTIFTNVYTYLDVFMLDFGKAGLVVGPLLLGVLVGILSSKVYGRLALPALMLYCYAAYGLSISYMNNEFIRINWIFVAMMAAVMHVFSVATVRPESGKVTDEAVAGETVPGM